MRALEVVDIDEDGEAYGLKSEAGSGSSAMKVSW